MFIGHYGVGYALKQKAPDIPLWLLFLAVQLPDLLAFTLILLGVERIHYQPDPNPFFRTSIEYLPFSHSLAANLIYALVVWLVFAKAKGQRWGAVLALAVASHWLLDFIVHPADLPIFLDSPKVGLGLWRYPLASLAVEVLLASVAGVLCLRRLGLPSKGLIVLGLMLAAFAGMLFAPEPEAVRLDMGRRALVILVAYGLFALLAYFSERHPNRPASAGAIEV